jgi:hypothetical protein
LSSVLLRRPSCGISRCHRWWNWIIVAKGVVKSRNVGRWRLQGLTTKIFKVEARGNNAAARFPKGLSH